MSLIIVLNLFSDFLNVFLSSVFTTFEQIINESFLINVDDVFKLLVLL
jgi:hypothetical protein